VNWQSYRFAAGLERGFYSILALRVSIRTTPRVVGDAIFAGPVHFMKIKKPLKLGWVDFEEFRNLYSLKEPVREVLGALCVIDEKAIAGRVDTSPISSEVLFRRSEVHHPPRVFQYANPNKDSSHGLISPSRASLTGWASSEHHSQSQILCCISGSVEKTE